MHFRKTKNLCKKLTNAINALKIFVFLFFSVNLKMHQLIQTTMECYATPLWLWRAVPSSLLSLSFLPVWTKWLLASMSKVRDGNKCLSSLILAAKRRVWKITFPSMQINSEYKGHVWGKSLYEKLWPAFGVQSSQMLVKIFFFCVSHN